MSRVERNRSSREGSQQAPRARQRSLFRWIAAGSVATFLVTSTYQVSWGQGSGGDHNGGGLTSGEIAAIVVGGLAVGGGLFYLLGGRRRKKHHDEDQQKAMSLPEGKKVGQLRLVPASDAVEAGDRDTFDLQAKGEDGEWYTVTAKDGASIDVKDTDSGLVRQDGAKNIFCLPMTTPASYDGKAVTLVGQYQTSEGSTLSAETRVTLHVSGELAAAR